MRGSEREIGARDERGERGASGGENWGDFGARPAGASREAHSMYEVGISQVDKRILNLC